MKKTFLFLLAFSSSLTALAQNGPLKIGVKAGVTIPNINTSSDAIAFDGGGVKESSVYPSFYFGATVDIPLAKNAIFQPGFSIVGKGTKVSYYNYLPNSPTSGKISLTYLEVPANAILNFPVGKGKVFTGLGPYLAYALTGTGKYTYQNSDDVKAGKQSIKFGYSENFKRLDVGGNVLAGYHLSNGLNVHAGISASLFKISNSSDTYLNARNLVYSFGLGFAL